MMSPVPSPLRLLLMMSPVPSPLRLLLMMSPVSSLLHLLLMTSLLCGGSVALRCGRGYSASFVLDTEDAVEHGAVLLSTTSGRSQGECEVACCRETHCNLALTEPSGNCTLFDCVYRNRFVCKKFQSRSGYLTFVTDNVYKTYLKAPPRTDGQSRRPIAVGARDLVVQPGESVLLNGVESRGPDNDILDYKWSLAHGNGSVTIQTTEFPDQARVSGLDVGLYKFQLTVTDAKGHSATDEVLVLVLSPEQSSLYCLASPKVGPCRAAFTRWHYDAAAGACVNFTYGGCRGNHNNYLSAEACETACRGVSASLARSAPPPVAGVCGAQCVEGQLTCDTNCCVHKSLECDGVTQCRDGTDELNCGKLNQTFDRLVNIEVDQKKARCTLPPYTGPCRARFPRWFYDPLQETCQSFTFGGCEANDNNHETKEECTSSCEGVMKQDVYSPGMFKRFGEEDESESGSIALAVVLTVSLLALLAVVVYCLLRRKKDQGPIAVSQTDQD